MKDQECVGFLQWCLPRLRLRWPGYRKVRRTVCKRLGRRLRELGLADLDAYRTYLQAHAAEWRYLDAACRIPISRFWRDRAVFAALADTILPGLARAALRRPGHVVRCWSAGCASGEEAYGLAIAWTLSAAHAAPGARIDVLGTDAEPVMVARAEAGCYRRGTLKDLPDGLIESAFAADGDLWCVRPEMRRGVRFALQDIRDDMPDGPFDLILCRNLVFTYFDDALQREMLSRILSRLRQTGILIIGGHERLPAGAHGLVPALPNLPVYRKGADPRPPQGTDVKRTPP